MKNDSLKIMVLEDQPLDQELIKRTVKKAFPNAVFIVAQSKKEYLERLGWGAPDVILSDYHIPGYNGLEALLYAKEHFPFVPFLFVTGMLNDEEKAAEVILKGAHGYVLKENLSSLPPALEAVLKNNKALAAQRESLHKKENKKKILLQKLQALLEQSSDFDTKGEALSVLEELQSL
ncbi:MAG: response regulator transcription factor [Lewinellaceae bacterium]|nr:response regulator transcription factor [Phaeodactylibacter sp.]MCB9039176.1 response regulator transcription factor [Lewinellaceae bacterium]